MVGARCRALITPLAWRIRMLTLLLRAYLLRYAGQVAVVVALLVVQTVGNDGADAVGLPIVPVVSIGGQETAFLARGERLAHAVGLDRAADHRLSC